MVVIKLFDFQEVLHRESENRKLLKALSHEKPLLHLQCRDKRQINNLIYEKIIREILQRADAQRDQGNKGKTSVHLQSLSETKARIKNKLVLM